MMSAPMRILVTVLGLVAVAGLVGVLVCMPLVKRAAADRQAALERRAELVKLERVARRISDLKQEIARLEAALAFFEDRLPHEREIDVILREVWLIAEAQGLTPRSVRTSAPQLRNRYHAQPVTLALEGRFESFYEFLLGLERLPRLTKVRQIQIAKSPLTEGVVQADILMDIFFEN